MENKGPRILVIDDEQQIRRFLRVSLTSHGFDVKDVETGQEGLDEVARFRPDVVILDLGLPDIDGQDVVRMLREWSKVPIIILSAKAQEFDKIAALDSGADDYVTKPFSMGELLARIRASLRHTISTSEEPILKFDDLSIDFALRHVKIGKTEVKLTPTEYDLVKHLAVNAGKVLTHQYLLRTVWGSTHEDDNQYIRVYMRQLRRKLEKDPSRPRHIISEPGVGYRLL
ncbi:DNA-binding response regulator in two-component regulatory system with KdpD [Candidatus Desulfosporosinus infrequens]|uniref:Stage 0 sporulation protein A homolog n=1 Tax=Candidatus Desulfosporosinus infrequens TaxID=2043169 RepID=A0A2U3KTS5_9FIRM|nr:DNA-binding response regulator in two-component regulatory system with KdpD [Candidatus Desulfosporosinus infrequens]